MESRVSLYTETAASSHDIMIMAVAEQPELARQLRPRGSRQTLDRALSTRLWAIILSHLHSHSIKGMVRVPK